MNRAVDAHFPSVERLYRRYKLEDRRIKTIINFRQMSVNRSRLCGGPTDALINTENGSLHQGFGVVSFPVGAVESLSYLEEQNGAAIHFGASVAHDPLRCNYSHTLVNGRIEKASIPLDGDLPKKARKYLRKQIWAAVVIEIPIEQAGEVLDED